MAWDRLTDEHPTFLIWDDEGVPLKGEWIPVLWRSYDGIGNSVYSIPKLVEEHADTLRSRFLEYIYEIGNARIKGKRLVDHMELRPGFSYWWMTLIAEKSNAYKSKQIVNVLKLFALEDLVDAHSVSTIILASNDKVLVQTFRMWCKNADFIFDWRPLQKNRESIPVLRMLYRALPKSAQAAFLIARYIWQLWPLKQQNEYKNIADSDEITFVDYLVHLDKKALISGRFASNFWTDLVDVIDRSGLRVNWLHRYIQHEAITSPKQAQDLIARFNQTETKRQFHFLLDCALSFSVVLATLVDYFRLAWMSLRLNKIRHLFRCTDSMLNLWPLFRQDWRNSMKGQDAIFNCLVLNLFERAMKRLPHQKLGIYLQENQGWEMAFIHAWRTAGHGQLIGVPHATVRYWDLRYFFDPRSYSHKDKNGLPMPDLVTLNGPAMEKAYQKGGYPENEMAVVEALRYLYLADSSQERRITEDDTGVLRVLVLGDYLKTTTHQQMQWLETAAQNLPSDTRYTVKPHPACAINSNDYPSLRMQIVNDNLAELMANCDVVFTGNITSASVDAYCTGLPVVSMLLGNSFNMSPLRGMKGVKYVTNPAELSDALRSIQNRTHEVDEPYFCLDRRLPRWREILGMNLIDITESIEKG